MDFPESEDAPISLPPAAEEEGFTFLGEAEAPAADDAAAFVGDVQDATDGMEAMGFAAAPDGGDDDLGMEYAGFASAPDDDDDDGMMGFADAPIVLGGPPPPSEDAPIIMGLEPAADEEEAKPEEPKLASAMAKFNAEWQETLAQRKDEENDAKVEMEAAAKAFMDEFQAKREAKRDAKLARNREDEQAKLEDIEADLENDNNWQRVSKMVDLTQDGSIEDNEDTKRMRDVFILLKNEAGLAAKVGA
jgi:hypothetical protein